VRVIFHEKTSQTFKEKFIWQHCFAAVIYIIFLILNCQISITIAKKIGFGLGKMLPATFSRLVPVLRSSASDVRPGRSIMVRYFKNKQTEAERLPTVIFVPGFMSHGLGLKAEYLARHCSKKYNYLCYDPEGKLALSEFTFSSSIYELGQKPN
jgi:hypothetical protein